MADDSKNGTLRTNLGLGVNAVRTGTGVMIDSVVEVAAAASSGSVYTMMRLPSNARIHGTSRIHADDLASEGAPTLDIGIKGVDGNVADNDDAINDGIDLTAAVSFAGVIKDVANWGKYLWELCGATSDFGGFVDITLKIQDAAANTGGTIAMCVHYTTE